MQVREVNVSSNNREDSFHVQCGVCPRTTRVSTRYGRVQGVRLCWLQFPESWWIFVPKRPLDVKSLNVRCPDHIPNEVTP